MHGIRTIRVAMAFAVAATLLPMSARAQECPGGHPSFGSLGIGKFKCVGGACRVSERFGDSYAHSFSTEPRVHDIDPGGPSAGELRDGDVIVSLDGVLITTLEGGRRLGALEPGASVDLTVRRGSRELDLELTAVRSCELPRLDVSLESRLLSGLPYRRLTGGDSSLLRSYGPLLRADSLVFSYGLPSDSRLALIPPSSDSSLVYRFTRPDKLGQTYGFTRSDSSALFLPWVQTYLGERGSGPPVEFGLELTCGTCGWVGSGQRSAFRTTEFPIVNSVEKGGPADEAGILPGDILLTVEGKAITSDEAGRLLGSLRAGESVSLEIRRADRIVALQITPREAAARRQRM